MIKIPEEVIGSLFVPKEIQDKLIERALTNFLNHKNWEELRKTNPEIIRKLKEDLRKKLNIVGHRDSIEYYVTLKYSFIQLERIVLTLKDWDK